MASFYNTIYYFLICSDISFQFNIWLSLFGVYFILMIYPSLLVFHDLLIIILWSVLISGKARLPTPLAFKKYISSKLWYQDYWYHILFHTPRSLKSWKEFQFFHQIFIFNSFNSFVNFCSMYNFDSRYLFCWCFKVC